MQITREADYALRCVQYLTGKVGTITMVDEISREMHIPKTFLAKIVQKLGKAGILHSFRGVKGGFELARNPGRITILEVVEAIQGPVAMNICAVNPTNCGMSPQCSIHPVWVEVRRKVEQMLRKKTFADVRRSK